MGTVSVTYSPHRDSPCYVTISFVSVKARHSTKLPATRCSAFLLSGPEIAPLPPTHAPSLTWGSSSAQSSIFKGFYFLKILYTKKSLLASVIKELDSQLLQSCKPKSTSVPRIPWKEKNGSLAIIASFTFQGFGGSQWLSGLHSFKGCIQLHTHRQAR